MPFKDIATSDSIFLRKVPPKGADKERLALKRMQEVGVGVLAPAQELTAAPILNAIAVFALSEVAKGEAKMPEGAMRMAISVRGDESDAEMAKLKGSGAVMLLVETPKGNYFSNVLYIVTVHSKHTRTLTFENVW
jgi:(E)-4-hydroxy-3-methylbut-2-enyl-diphosphate synthase